MSRDDPTRRTFLSIAAGGLGAAWYALHAVSHRRALEHARQAAAAGTPGPFTFFTAEQAADVDAIAAQIIPTDATPGARELGALYFIDHALTAFWPEQQVTYTTGLAQLSETVATRYPGVARFAQLDGARQSEVLHSIEKGEFFDLVRAHTLMGCFGNPEYGGNRDKAGWRLIGFEDRFVWSAPFGYYDRATGSTD